MGGIGEEGEREEDMDAIVELLRLAREEKSSRPPTTLEGTETLFIKFTSPFETRSKIKAKIDMSKNTCLTLDDG